METQSDTNSREDNGRDFNREEIEALRVLSHLLNQVVSSFLICLRLKIQFQNLGKLI